MIAWAVFALMAGAVIAAFRAAWVLLMARSARAMGECSAPSYLQKRHDALVCALWSAGCLVVLSLGGLWRVAHMVTR